MAFHLLDIAKFQENNNSSTLRDINTDINITDIKKRKKTKIKPNGLF